jgi:shikimate kinase
MTILRKNIVLIGMPAVGKSTVGVLLAKRMGFAFVDTDLIIQTGESRRLATIIAQEGYMGFRRIEERWILSVKGNKQVIATGGSVVYSPLAMAHLAKEGLVVFLKIGLKALIKRLGDLDDRGVLRPPGMEIDDLYAERDPLYRQYAAIVIHTDGLSADQVVSAIQTQVI